ncbi:MAG: LptF/LptG family permease [Aquificae bacterium]|nr:LptF/LptG family permease [Aquificota bacterium]
MKILYRYLYRKLAVYLLVLVPSFTFVAVLVELVELLRKAKNLDYQAIALFVLFQSPEKIYYILPVSVVVAFFMLARDLINRREIYPILLNGISLRRLGLALFLFPTFISLLQLANLELVMPQAKRKAEQIYGFIKQKPQKEPLIAYNSWVVLDKNTFLYFSFLDLKNKKGKNVVILKHDENFRPVLRIEGREFYISDRIKIKNSKVIKIKSETEISLTRHKEYQFPKKIDVESFKRLVKVKKPVSIRQLYRSAVIAEKFGYPASYYWSKMYSNIATLLSPIVLSFTFYPLLWSRKKTNVVVIAVMLFAYWYATAFLTSIAQSNVIPYYGIFAVDLVYLLIGTVLFSRLKFVEL